MGIICGLSVAGFVHRWLIHWNYPSFWIICAGDVQHSWAMLHLKAIYFKFFLQLLCLSPPVHSCQLTCVFFFPGPGFLITSFAGELRSRELEGSEREVVWWKRHLLACFCCYCFFCLFVLFEVFSPISIVQLLHIFRDSNNWFNLWPWVFEISANCSPWSLLVITYKKSILWVRFFQFSSRFKATTFFIHERSC